MKEYFTQAGWFTFDELIVYGLARKNGRHFEYLEALLQDGRTIEFYSRFPGDVQFCMNARGSYLSRIVCRNIVAYTQRHSIGIPEQVKPFLI